MKTKKYLLIILLIIPLISAAQANFGILLGIGRSNIDNYRLYFTRNTSDEPHDVVGYPFESYYAWKAGFYYTIPINKKGLSAGCEFNLSGLGAFIPGGSIEINPGDYSYQPEYAERLIYISIPMYIQYNFGSCWYISTGVTTGLLISKPVELNSLHFSIFFFAGSFRYYF